MQSRPSFSPFGERSSPRQTFTNSFVVTFSRTISDMSWKMSNPPLLQWRLPHEINWTFYRTRQSIGSTRERTGIRVAYSCALLPRFNQNGFQCREGFQKFSGHVPGDFRTVKTLWDSGWTVREGLTASSASVFACVRVDRASLQAAKPLVYVSQSPAQWETVLLNRQFSKLKPHQKHLFVGSDIGKFHPVSNRLVAANWEEGFLGNDRCTQKKGRTSAR